MFRYRKRTFVLEVFTILAVIVLLTPFWILVMTSLKAGEQVLTTPAFEPPKQPTLENFRTCCRRTARPRTAIFSGLQTSAIITIGSILGLVCFGSITAYALVRGKSRWTQPLLLPVPDRDHPADPARRAAALCRGAQPRAGRLQDRA